MYTRKRYALDRTLLWTKNYWIFALTYSFVIYFLEYTFNAKKLVLIPWELITLLGIAVSFYVGFKNNNAYDRTWEARKIWGAIVNDSRSFGSGIVHMLQTKNSKIQRQVIYRHIAWLITLQRQLRVSRKWENQSNRLPMYDTKIDDSFRVTLKKKLKPFLNDKELSDIDHYANYATHLLDLQTKAIEAAYRYNEIDSYGRVYLLQFVSRFYDGQGKSERINNFPLPRQYSSTAFWLTVFFVALIPFGTVGIISPHTELYWLSWFFTAFIMWVFLLMEKIGNTAENPFEASFSDVPITSISNAIEVDLLQMLGEKDKISKEKGKFTDYEI